MPGMVEVFGHMFIPRLVATEGGAAGLTSAQMHPAAADLDTFFADVLFCLFELLDRLHVPAGLFVGHKNEFVRPLGPLG